MWIIDIPLSCDEVSDGYRSLVLKRGKTYSLGRSPDNDLHVNLKKVSRLQMNMKVLDDNTLEISNVGQATWFDNEKRELKGGHETTFFLTKDNILKLKSSFWKFKIFIINDFQISKSLNDEIGCDFFDVSDNLEYDFINLNGIIGKIKQLSQWIDKMKKKEWNVNGKLNIYITPQIETQVVNLDDDMTDNETNDENVEEEKKSPIEEKEIDDDLVMFENEEKLKSKMENEITKKPSIDIPEVAPFYSQLSNRKSVRSKKSQLTRMFDEIDDLEDLETYTSQATQKALSQTTQNKPLNSTNIPKTFNLIQEEEEKEEEEPSQLLDISRLSLKRTIPTENDTPSKKLKPLLELRNEENKNKLDKPDGIIKENSSLNFTSKNNGPNKLAEIFKKTKQIKIDKILADEKLINSPLNSVKIKKFQLNLQPKNTINPKVYSNYNLSFGDNPQWENRLNYSKFMKSTSGYNPIMDSTIKTVKFKNSNYKSNEVQVNLEQNNDMIPELDVMFPSESHNTRKRRREQTLFVDSDDDVFEEVQTIRTINTPRNRINDKLDGYENISNSRNQSSLPASSNRKQHRTIDIGDDDIDNDDDIPVFKSRRR
ncbi:hypothetical protein C6P40_002934 [Pichia californica]|uniref:FHA domain-containing protein n=1 Tax=Pichia californica TaxID=460514 RepID=A0A9P6WNN8_9ASCO|nr:hypothetical protein C6P40_002934 [[Candida] californica]